MQNIMALSFTSFPEVDKKLYKYCWIIVTEFRVEPVIKNQSLKKLKGQIKITLVSPLGLLRCFRSFKMKEKRNIQQLATIRHP